MAKAPKEKEEENREEAPPQEEALLEETGPEPTSSHKKKFIIIGSVLVALLLIVPLTLHLTGIFPLFDSKKHEEVQKKEKSGHGPQGEGTLASNLPPPPVTLALDEFLVNLDTPGKQARFLKMTIVLELPTEEDKEAITPYVPRIRDSFQLYLRELREDDVKGSAALYRLREELMLRLSKVVYPIKVNDILFKEILTQ